MGVLKEDEFETFMKRRAGTMNGILIHGADSSAVNALGQQALKFVVGANDASFATVRLDRSSLKENSSRLDDEFRSMSLLGERRVIVLDAVEETDLKFLNSILLASETGNFIVLLADALGKTSKLRLAVEGADKFSSLAIYEEDASALALRIRKLLSAEQLSWHDDAEDMFFATVGYDRSTAVAEAQKLCLYCLGQDKVLAADVVAVCGDSAAFGADELIDAVLAGDIEKVDRSYSSLDSELGGNRAILAMFLLHLTRLQNLQLDMARGMNAELAVRNAKPMIFFKRRNAVVSQLRNFDMEQLTSFQQSVSAAMFQARKSADLFDAITSRALLSLARLARSAKS
jgi:DNA polymerase III subunit delta